MVDAGGTTVARRSGRFDVDRLAARKPLVWGAGGVGGAGAGAGQRGAKGAEDRPGLDDGVRSSEQATGDVSPDRWVDGTDAGGVEELEPAVGSVGAGGRLGHKRELVGG